MGGLQDRGCKRKERGCAMLKRIAAVFLGMALAAPLGCGACKDIDPVYMCLGESVRPAGGPL